MIQELKLSKRQRQRKRKYGKAFCSIIPVYASDLPDMTKTFVDAVLGLSSSDFDSFLNTLKKKGEKND